jgi:hypothetical protein
LIPKSASGSAICNALSFQPHHAKKLACALIFAPRVPCNPGDGNFHGEFADAVFQKKNTMASKFIRRLKWWIKFRDPATGEVVRESLDTPDAARAELLRQRLELEIALLEPRFQAAEIPGGIRARLRLGAAPVADTNSSLAPSAAPVPVRCLIFNRCLAFDKFDHRSFLASSMRGCSKAVA